MSDKHTELQVLLDRVRQGDEDAARELLQLFEPHVRRVVRLRLPHALRSKFDSMDFVQSVWGSFFAHLNRGEIDFESRGQLCNFLVSAAQAKVDYESRRRLRAGKFDVHKERQIEQDAENPIFTSPDPRPSQVAVAHDLLENAMRGRPPIHQQILRLRSQGYTFVEIAAQVGIDERSARRIVQGIEEQLGLNHAGQ